MKSSLPVFALASFVFLWLGGCATAKKWTVTKADKSEGVVRVSYEYPEFHEPQLSDAQAAKLAKSRCASWGYSAAEEIPGQLRQCSNRNGDNCDVWTVTREYQCRSADSLSARLSKLAGGAGS